VQEAERKIETHSAEHAAIACEVANWTDTLTELPAHVRARKTPEPADQDSTAACDEMSSSSNLIECRTACKKRKKAWERARTAAAALPRAEISAERRGALRARRERVATAESRLQLLDDAVAVLRQDVKRSKVAAFALNERVFARGAASFRATMASCLPDFRFELVATGAHAADGVAVRFRKGRAAAAGDCENSAARANAADDDMDSGEHEHGWSTNLAELSGGQRSLCSLAFILAATTAGIAPSLMLVDEVDAALDDVNQTRVGTMLQRCSAAHGCQVLAVSHSAAFHGWCDSFVKVSRDGKGTGVSVAAGKGASGGAGKLGGASVGTGAVLGRGSAKVRRVGK
jgi:chromosome segregation ATPase